MDNRVIDIKSETREAFDLSIHLMFHTKYGMAKATHYIDDSSKGLILLRSEAPKAVKLPVAMDWKKAADLAWSWLEEQPEDKYKEWCDHDGSNGRGFHVYNEDWGRVNGLWQAICAVQPIWAWYGK